MKTFLIQCDPEKKVNSIIRHIAYCYKYKIVDVDSCEDDEYGSSQGYWNVTVDEDVPGTYEENLKTVEEHFVWNNV